MKNILYIFIFTLFLLSGCASSEGAVTVPPNPESTAYIDLADTHVKDEPDIFVIEAREQYAKAYNTTHIFTDMYIPEKAWLIGEEQIIELVCIAGFNDVTVLARDHIERIEQASLSDFARVTVFDKTGQSISLTVHSEDLFEILEHLK